LQTSHLQGMFIPEEWNISDAREQLTNKLSTSHCREMFIREQWDLCGYREQLTSNTNDSGDEIEGPPSIAECLSRSHDTSMTLGNNLQPSLRDSREQLTPNTNGTGEGSSKMLRLKSV
jgi:hypothetical protein